MCVCVVSPVVPVFKTLSERAGLGCVYVCFFKSQKSSAGVETRSQVEVFHACSSVPASGLVTLDRACDDQMMCNKS